MENFDVKAYLMLKLYFAKALILFLLIIIKKQIKNNFNKFINIHQFYRELLQLYIENREKYYIKGREYEMNLIGQNYNDSNIETFEDKLNYLLVHENPENKTEIVDKILLRNYSKKIIGKDICVPILKIYNHVDDINLDELPEKFVLKCNHGSGMNILCKNKKSFNLNEAKRQLKKWMGINYGLQHFEAQYLNIKRKIFVEKYLSDNIFDYKVNCFNGEPKFIRVRSIINGRNINNHYSLNWTLLNIALNYQNYLRDPSTHIKRPVNLDKMINYSKLLSSDFAFCRVDFYEIDNILYLGELTFSPFNVEVQYNDLKTRKYLGNLINLTKIKK